MQCLENIKHDIEASPKCNSNLIKANLPFFPEEKALGFLFFQREALSLLQISARSCESLCNSE